MIENSHNKKLAIIIFLVILVLLSACQANPQPAPQQPLPEILVGYCPTMSPHVQTLAQAHQNVTPVLYDNSAVAIQALYAGDVHGILIGRVAWNLELSEQLRLVRLVDGLTLIAQHPGVVRFEDLAKIRIFTQENETAIQEIIPIRVNVTYYDDFNQMLADFDGNSALLVRWSQVSPLDNLLIPVDPTGNKVAAFRSPHFYYLVTQEDQLAPLLSTFSTQ